MKVYRDSLVSCNADTVVLTVNGLQITRAEYDVLKSNVLAEVLARPGWQQYDAMLEQIIIMLQKNYNLTKKDVV